MRIIVVGGVTERNNIDAQVAKQTIQPDYSFFHIDDSPAQTIDERRKRIAHNQHMLQEAVRDYDVDLVWQVESDNDMPEDTLEKLLATYIVMNERNEDLGYVSGIQVGRHGVYALGAWHFAQDRQSFNSVDYKAQGLVEVDATGFYCLLASKDVWLKGQASWNGERWGPDVVYGLNLKDQGYRMFVNMDIKIGHKTHSGIIHPDHPSTENVRFYITDKGWEYKTYAI